MLGLAFPVRTLADMSGRWAAASISRQRPPFVFPSPSDSRSPHAAPRGRRPDLPLVTEDAILPSRGASGFSSDRVLWVTSLASVCCPVSNVLQLPLTCTQVALGSVGSGGDHHLTRAVIPIFTSRKERLLRLPLQWACTQEASHDESFGGRPRPCLGLCAPELGAERAGNRRWRPD